MSERDEKVVQLMKRQRPVSAIAELCGLEPDYCRKTIKKLAEERSIDYRPGKEFPTDELLTEASHRLRSNLARIMHDLRENPDWHPVGISTATGITQSQQVQMKDRPYSYDPKISNLERLARVTDRDFTDMMLAALILDPMNLDASRERLKRVRACLNS